MFFKKPYCPWCRGPVQRIDRHHWTCAPCTELHQNAVRDQIDPPWIDGVDPLDGTLPEALHENRFHETFTGTVNAWMVRAEKAGSWHAGEIRKAQRRARATKRIHNQVREALNRGIEPLLDRHAVSNKKLSTLFHEVVAKDLRIEAMESLLYWNLDTEALAALISDGFDEPIDQHRMVDYLHTWLGHVGTLPADHNVVLNDGGWTNHGEPVWLIYYGNSVPPGTSDDDIDTIARAYLNAGAYLDINGMVTGRHHGYRFSNDWQEHLHTRLRIVGMQVFDERIAAGYDLHHLYDRSFQSLEAVEKLMAAGLSFRDAGPGAFSDLIEHQPALALEVLKAGLPKHVVDSDHDGPFPIHEAVRMVTGTKRASELYDLYIEIVQALLDAGVNVNAVERNTERTAGIYALRDGHEELFHLLHRHGARIEPCIAFVQGLLNESNRERKQRERVLALLVGIQQDELRTVLADTVEPVQRSAGRRRL